MIERLTDFDGLSGVSSPLLPLLYVDFKFSMNEIDGVYRQIVGGEETVLLSVKNCCANVLKLSDNYDCDELKTFLKFLNIDNIVSDFNFDDQLKECVFMEKPLIEGEQIDACVLCNASDTNAYKNVFSLLDSGSNDFADWFPVFSKKINHGNSAAVYISENGSPVSCAVSPAVFSGIGVIGGVCTAEAFRSKGYGSRCVKALLNTLFGMGVSKACLWCEEHNVEFYKKLGFSDISCVYIREGF